MKLAPTIPVDVAMNDRRLQWLIDSDVVRAHTRSGTRSVQCAVTYPQQSLHVCRFPESLLAFGTRCELLVCLGTVGARCRAAGLQAALCWRDDNSAQNSLRDLLRLTGCTMDSTSVSPVSSSHGYPLGSVELLSARLGAPVDSGECKKGQG